MKECSKCLIMVNYDHFYKRSSYKDGHSTWCIKCTLEYTKMYKLNHMEAKRIRQNEWRRNTNYRKIRYHSDVNYKLAHSLRTRLNSVIRNKNKVGSAVRDLGCSIQELKIHLESKFQPGMTWENHGVHGWHIDHIKPLASFDLTNEKQLKEACNYINLQPLWAKDNLSKGILCLNG